ncbi:MAG: MFS transporter [Gammaproteobacteria bacterium]|nr:MFS transporter [Gammaproteobacteria bacterium]
MPFLIVCYVIAFIDRSNIGFAKLQFTGDLGFSESIYGFGAGIFYIGYIFLEIPSNLHLSRHGVRKTLLRIMVLWGLCCAGLAFMATPGHYYGLRFLLGAAEAGLFPGILLYMTYWVPASRRARFTALFMASIPISGTIGGPVAGTVMQSFDGVMGMHGWQWLFIIEGLPAVLTGVVAYWYLDDKPDTSRWLTRQQKELVRDDLAAEQQAGGPKRHPSFLHALKDPRFYALAAPAFALMVSTGGIFFWLPSILRSAGIESVWNIGMLSTVPFTVAFVIQFLVARRSDRKQERCMHAALPLVAAAVGWSLLPLAASNVPVSLLLLTIASAGTFGAMGPFWSLPGTFLSGTAAAGGIALITTLAGLGNFISPTLVGWLVDQTGNLAVAQFYFGGLLLIGAVVLMVWIKPICTVTPFKA